MVRDASSGIYTSIELSRQVLPPPNRIQLPSVRGEPRNPGTLRGDASEPSLQEEASPLPPVLTGLGWFPKHLSLSGTLNSLDCH